MSGGLGVALRELRRLPEVWRAPQLTADEVDRRALAEVNRMLEHAFTSVPYYRGQSPPQLPLPSLARLDQFPVLTKRDVLDAGVERFRTPGLAPSSYQVDVTSGTTGTRLEVWHDVDCYGYQGAAVLRRFLRSGYRPWWTIAQIKPFDRPARWFQRLGLFPRVVVNAGQSQEAIAADLLRIRPRLLMAYPVVLRAMLRTLSPAELARLRSRLRLVFTDSELLTDETAELFEREFGVPILDEYSAYEVLTMATECRSGSMHIDADRTWIEIVGPDGRPVPDGTEGVVTVTHFRERAMPLVRYQVGDRATMVPGRCACGSPFRRLKLTSGRVNDFITLPSGRHVFSGVFLSVAMFADGVAECMVRQAADGTVTVHLVPSGSGPDAFADGVAGFARAFADLVDEPVDFVFEPTDRVTLTPGGKGKFLESDYRPG